MLEWLDIASKLHQKYGGKIFAVGEVIESSYYAPTEQEDTDLIHWRSSIYADIRFQVLQKPIDISEFNDFITVSRRGAITPVFGDAFLRLKNIIREKNFTLDYLNKSQSVPVPLSEIDSSNWLELTSKYRRSFLLESQFRTFYVDYLLNEINETDMLYRECRCCKDSIHDSFVDNVIYIDKKYLPVEIKLSVENIGEEAITKQVNKYCNNTKIYLNSKKIIYPEQIHKSVLIIDTTYVYIYSAEQKTIRKIYTLDRLYDTNDLLLKLKGILQDRIEESIENPDFIPASVREIAKQL